MTATPRVEIEIANEVESAALEMAVNSRKTVDSVLMAHGYTAEQCQAIVGQRNFPTHISPAPVESQAKAG